jgi:hypothetical protein
MKKKEATGNKKSGTQEEVLTRRKAIKRIASLFAVAVISTKIKEVPQEFQVAYLSSPPYNPYADSVYGSSRGGYYSIQYYTSYRSHYTSVPPPYSSRR